MCLVCHCLTFNTVDRGILIARLRALSAPLAIPGLVLYLI